MKQYLYEIYDAMDSIVNTETPIDELTISNTIGSFKKSIPEDELQKEFLWESMAFDFAERRYNDETQKIISGQCGLS